MRLRNNIFAAALDELKRRQIVKTQKELAQKMGVSEDTITRILKDRTEVTEDAISKLQTASGCIFNLQWLRGESDIMLMEKANEPQKSAPIDADLYHRTLVSNANIIAELRKDLEYFKALVLDKDALIQEHNEQLAELAAIKKDLEYTRATLDSVRKNFDQKVKELDERDHLIKTLQAELAAKGTAHQFPLGVADGDGERPLLTTDE